MRRESVFLINPLNQNSQHAAHTQTGWSSDRQFSFSLFYLLFKKTFEPTDRKPKDAITWDSSLSLPPDSAFLHAVQSDGSAACVYKLSYSSIITSYLEVVGCSRWGWQDICLLSVSGWSVWRLSKECKKMTQHWGGERGCSSKMINWKPWGHKSNKTSGREETDKSEQ